MNIDDDGRRRTLRRTAALISLLAIGGGAWVGMVRSGGQIEASTGVIEPLLPPLRAADAPAMPVESAHRPTASPSVSRPQVDPAQLAPSVRAALAQARAAYSRPIQHAVGRPAAGPVRERSEKSAQGTIRVVSARYDLTGQRELGLAADRGQAVGRSRCTQRLRFSSESVGQLKPSILLCWRTSSRRSVVTLAVSPHGTPWPEASVAAIDREWSALA
jgi:hypothetical protein